MEKSSGFGALNGLKVIDLTQVLAGPFATQLLADHGADVVKVEPLAGEFYRHSMPVRAEDAERRYPGYFLSMNRNKRSLAVDLKTEEGRAIVRRLAQDADVLVENFRAGVMERLGLSYESLREANPRLVYAAIRGFGDTRVRASPMADWPGMDIVAQAMGGVMSATGPDANTPMKVGPSIGDHVPGIFCAFGILAAVLRARATGEGQFVDISLVDSMLAISERIIHQLSIEGVVAQPEGNHHPMMCPYGAFPAADGWVTIACQTDEFWRSFCRAMQAEHLLDDTRFLDREKRSANKAALQEIISSMTKQLTKAELGERLGGKVPFGPVLAADEILHHPHFEARGMIAALAYPGLAEPVHAVGTPVLLSETPGRVERRAPDLGEHTDEILRASGLSVEAIRALRERNVIR